jgi:hypothetical protein
MDEREGGNVHRPEEPVTLQPGESATFELDCDDVLAAAIEAGKRIAILPASRTDSLGHGRYRKEHWVTIDGEPYKAFIVDYTLRELRRWWKQWPFRWKLRVRRAKSCSDPDK